MDVAPPELRVLGRVELHGRTLRSMAAADVLSWAALHGGRGIDLDRCARSVWPELSPVAGRRRARDAARGLAREFPGTVRTAGGGLDLMVARDRVDEHAFRTLIGRSDHGTDTRTEPAADGGTDRAADGEQRRLAAALELWRGNPYPRLRHVPLAAQRIERLQQLRLDALERRFALALRRTPDVTLVAGLRAAVCTHPQRERLWRLLAAALYSVSRQVEALAEIETCRRSLRDRGVAVTPGLDLLRNAMLRGDESALRSAL